MQLNVTKNIFLFLKPMYRSKQQMWFCYILRCIDENHPNLTYNGKTNNIVKRLNQHNGKIKGGAKSTKGKQWEVYALLTGFPNEQNALSCEWRIKHPTKSRKRPSKYCGVNGRILGLNEVLICNKWTDKCKCNNDDSNFKLYLTCDVIYMINIDLVPDNIEIFKVKKMGKTFLSKVMDGIY